MTTMEKQPGVQGSNPLEQFVLLAKNTRGAAAVELVKQVLEAPGVYVFGELLDMPHIQEVWMHWLKSHIYLPLWYCVSAPISVPVKYLWDWRKLLD